MISVCMIVKNEESFISDCIKSIRPISDDIHIVDTGSTDATMDMIREFPSINLREFKWCDDFSAARNESIRLAGHPWILIIDADERLAEVSREEVLSMANGPAGADGPITIYGAKIRNQTLDGKLINTDFSPRLHPNRPDVRYSCRVHEKISHPKGVSITLNNKFILEHLGADRSIVSAKKKVSRNLKLLNLAILEEPERIDLKIYAMYELEHGCQYKDAIKLGCAICDELCQMNEEYPGRKRALPDVVHRLAKCFRCVGEFENLYNVGELASKHCAESSWLDLEIAMGQILDSKPASAMNTLCAIPTKVYKNKAVYQNMDVLHWLVPRYIGECHLAMGNNDMALKVFQTILPFLPSPDLEIVSGYIEALNQGYNRLREGEAPLATHADEILHVGTYEGEIE